MKYDYYEVTTNNILKYIEENINFSDFESREELEEKLYDDCWISDSVTGNASGSYTFNRYKAQKLVLDNMELCTEALKEFCVPMEEVAEKLLEENWEYFDVTIRCYILGTCISNALDSLEEANENMFTEA